MTPEDAILTLVTAAAGGVPVFLSDDAPSVPPPPCIALAVRWVQAGPAETGPVDADGNQLVRDHRDATVELRSVGAAAYRALDKLGLALRHPVHEDRAEALGLAVFHAGPVQRVPRDGNDATPGTMGEPRGALDLGIRYAQTYTDVVGLIETVTGNITTTGGLLPSFTTSFSAKTEATN